MSSKLIFLTLFVLLGCGGKKIPKNHIQKVTLKLEKSVDIKLTKIGKSFANFNIVADIESVKPIISADIQWMVISPENEKILTRSESYKGPNKQIRFDSGTISLPNSEVNHKIVFIFKGRTELEDIYKSEIYNSLIQEDLNRAIKELEERGRY